MSSRRNEREGLEKVSDAEEVVAGRDKIRRG
jgi:hypothetical protein